MAAPTPVSAYLHSATMVKAGIFLMARLWPVLAGTPEWFWIVATTGLATMLVGGVIALFQDDLKGLLAYSTVSHLGLITMLLGFGTEAAATAAMFHIIAHATFKAALFMGAGIIDHGTHTRSIRQLGGLRSLMPLTFGLILVAALSMAGIPPFNGFLSKEMMLEQAAHQGETGAGWIIGALATLAALVSVAYSLRLVAHVFLGPARDDYPHAPHDPGPGLWAGPALLVGLVVVTGLFPNAMLGWLVAVGIRLATGSATVATITAAGIVTPLAAGLDQSTVALLALAVGAGSLFFSHVNDAGFWLVKEYFGMTVGQTLRSWSVMETLISVIGLVLVLLLDLII